MRVKDKMTKNPVTISPDDYIADALDIFKEHDFHRLPVVDRSNRLVGLITEELVSKHLPSQATSLSIHEINYLLNQTKIGDIMSKNVLTISPDALLEEAADLMIKNKNYCLVIPDQGRVIGVITEKDILSSFIAMQGYYNKGTRLVVRIDEDRPGILKDIATLLSAENISITHLICERILEGSKEVDIVIRVDETDSEKVKTIIGSHYKIMTIQSYQ